MKRMIALMLAVMMLLTAGVCAAEGTELTLNLATATDEELAAAAELIRAEQKARIKTGFVFEPAEVSIFKGKAAKIAATVEGLPDGVKVGKLVWETADKTVATASRGIIKGVEGGTTVVTCTTTLSDGTQITGEIPVTVTIPVQKIKLNTKKVEVTAGDTFTLDLTILPENATNKEVLYTSSNEGVVKPDENGKLRAVAQGKCKVTATARDGSKKSVKADVTVTKNVGSFTDELTFQGLAWGSDFENSWKKLQTAGLVDPEAEGSVRNAGDALYHWPEKDVLFADWDSFSKLPAAFGKAELGAMRARMKLLKDVEGYKPQQAMLEFLNPIGENGKVDGEKTSLKGVFLLFYDAENAPQMFTDLLAKLEAQYGEFSRYLAKAMTVELLHRNTYRAIEGAMAGAKIFTANGQGAGTNLIPSAVCVLRGKNDTGIMLMLDGYFTVYLFYGKTDVLNEITAMTPLLESAQGSWDGTTL